MKCGSRIPDHLLGQAKQKSSEKVSYFKIKWNTKFTNQDFANQETNAMNNGFMEI